MSGDVTIPCEMAADIAKALRNVAESWKPLGRSLAVERLREWADLLDPPPPTPKPPKPRWAGLKVGDRFKDGVVTALYDDPACDEDIVQFRYDDGVVGSRPADTVAHWVILGGGDE